MQTNIVRHQIDPWPAHARSVRIPTNGDRLQHAIERYRNGGNGTSSAPPPASPTRASENLQSRGSLN